MLPDNCMSIMSVRVLAVHIAKMKSSRILTHPFNPTQRGRSNDNIGPRQLPNPQTAKTEGNSQG